MRTLYASVLCLCTFVALSGISSFAQAEPQVKISDVVVGEINAKVVCGQLAERRFNSELAKEISLAKGRLVSVSAPSVAVGGNMIACATITFLDK